MRTHSAPVFGSRAFHAGSHGEASRALAAAHCQSQHALPARPPHSAAFEPGAQEGDLPGPRLRTPCWHRPAAVAVHRSRAMRPSPCPPPPPALAGTITGPGAGPLFCSAFFSNLLPWPALHSLHLWHPSLGICGDALSGIEERTQPQLNRTTSSSERRTSHPHHRPSGDRRLSPIPSPNRQCR